MEDENDKGLFSGTLTHEIAEEDMRELAFGAAILVAGGIVFNWLLNKI